MDSEYVIKSPFKDIIPVKNKTTPEFLWDEVDKHPHWKHAECLISGTTEKSYTYQNVHDLSKSFAAGLKNTLGLHDKEVVGILLPNCPEFIITFLGILDAGCVATLMNPSFKINELKPLAKIVEMRCIVTLEALLPVVLALKEDNKSLEKIIILDGYHPECINIGELFKTDFSNVSFLKGVDIDTTERTAVILFSSGTTGVPKGVMLTHYTICTNCLQVISNHDTFPRTGFNSKDGKQERILCILPLFHIYGLLFIVFNSIYLGGRLMTLPKFEPKLYIEAIKTFKPTINFLVPPLANFITLSPEFSSEDFEETHTIFCAAAPLGTALCTRLLEKVGIGRRHINFLETYGMTELSPASHVAPAYSKNTKLGTIGVLLPNTWAKIIDIKSGKTLGPNQAGEICVKGPQVMKGYFKNETATRDMINGDGYLHTGDIVRYDTEGFFYIEDRLKVIIKCKGFQVSPSELENIIREHSKVADVAVFGVYVQDEEVPRACIVRKDETLTEGEVQEWVDERVARYKRLAGGIEFVDAIPKSPSGKILRKDLIAAYKIKLGKDE